jgi:large subunit ribosomal protein L29
MARKEHEINYKEASIEELSGRIEKDRQDIFKLRFRASSAALKNPMEIRKLRREVARLATFINQRRKTG